MQDTGHVLVDALGGGAAYRNKLEEQFKSGERTFRDISDDMWGSLNIPFGDGFDLMAKTLEIDPGFQEFHQYCLKEGFPFNIISAGLKPVLQRTLDIFLGDEVWQLPTSTHIPANITGRYFEHRRKQPRGPRRYSLEACLASRLRHRARQGLQCERSAQSSAIGMLTR